MKVDSVINLNKWSWDIDRITNYRQTYDIESGSSRVKVGIVDSGIDINHPDLRGKITKTVSLIDNEPNVDYIGHGTAVAGQIAGNGILPGVGPGLSLVSYKVVNQDNKTSNNLILEAIDLAINDNIDIINLSVGSYINKERANEISNKYKLIVKKARENNIVLISSSGYKSLLKENFIHVPSDINGIISVSSINKRGDLSYDALNTSVDYYTPSGDFGEEYKISKKINIQEMCLVLYPIDKQPSFVNRLLKFPTGYEFLSGTSLSAAKLSGVVGVLQSYSLLLNGKKLENDLILSILNRSNTSNKEIPVVDLYRSLIILKRMFS